MEHDAERSSAQVAVEATEAVESVERAETATQVLQAVETDVAAETAQAEETDEVGIDLEQETGPSIDLTRLYRLWEANNWSAYAIDFSQDVRDWRERLTPLQRRAATWNYALFLHGEEAVARTLAPFVGAVYTQEQRVFLTTQIVDEARHHVFFSRFMQEVIGVGHDMQSALEAVRPDLTVGFRHVFDELDHLTDRLRRHPNDRVLLAQCIALYHLVIEGTLAHPGQHLIRDYVTKMGVLPGFAQGIASVSRDESRHMAFGVQVLGELIAASGATRRGVIHLLNRILPWTLSLFISQELGDDAVRVFGWELEDLYAFGLRSFDTKLRRAGIQPGEVATLVKIGGDGTPPDRARRALKLLRAGVFGSAAPLRMDDEILTMLFEGLQDVMNMRQPSIVPGAIQWDFSDAPPWYVEPAAGRACARQGRADAPVLTLRCSVEDWARIAGDKLNPTIALVTRRLKISGEPKLMLRLPAILGS